MGGRKLLFLVGGLFDLIGVGLLAGAAFANHSAAAFAAEALRASGTVVDLEAQRSSEGGTLYRPIVEFTDRDGRTLRVAAGGASSPPSHRRGDRVGVLYPPSAPEEARLDSWTDRWLVVVILGVLGGVFSVVGSVLLIVGLRVPKARVRTDLVERKRVEAKVVSVERVEGSFGRRTWTILAQWRDPDGFVHDFESDEISFDPTDHVRGRAVGVLIDPDDPEDYQVDLSFLPESG